MPSVQAQRWLDKALEDEEVVALIRSNGGPWSMAAYHVQQAAEKYVKAVLVETGVAPPKIHDLPQLVALLPGVAPSASLLAAAAMTSSYAWVTRYPGSNQFSEADINDAVSDLGQIKTWALSRL